MRIFWRIVAAGILVLLFGSSSFSETPPQNPQNNYANNEGGGNIYETTKASSIKEVISWFGLWSDEDITAFSTVIIGVFTIILGVGTVVLVADGRKHSRHSLRAYVFVDTIVAGDQGRAALGTSDNKVSAIFSYGYPAAFWIIKNTGQTPAYRVLHWGHVVVMNVSDESTLTAMIPRKLEHVSMSTIPTNGTLTKAVYVPERLTPEEITGLLRGTKAIYVFGRIEYVDAFRRQRFTSYRLRYTGQYPPPLEMTLSFCDRGNYTDESNED